MVQIYPLLATALFSDPKLGKKLYCEQIVPLLKMRGEVMRGVVKDGVACLVVEISEDDSVFLRKWCSLHRWCC